MSNLLALLLLCGPILCNAAYFIDDSSVSNKNGGIEVNITLNKEITETIEYGIFYKCTMSDEDDSTSSSMGPLPGGQGIMTISCENVTSNELQGCCDDCIKTGNMSSVVFLIGPLTAGANYGCELTASFTEGNATTFAFFDSEDFLSLTGLVINKLNTSFLIQFIIDDYIGIPSAPIILSATPLSNGSIIVTAGSEFKGTNPGEFVTYEVQLITQGTTTIVYSMNYTTMNYTIPAVASGDYTLTIWAINEYGKSNGSMIDVTVNASMLVTPSSTPSPPTTPPSPTDDDPSSGLFT